MGYEDRDYIREKPTFGYSFSMGPATKALIAVVVAGYLIGLVVGDTISFVGAFATDAGVRQFWGASGESGTQQFWARQLFVLTAADIAPWANNYAIGHWKILTSWIVAPTIISAVVDAFMVYFAGKWVEQVFGAKRFVMLFIGACMGAALMAGFVDPLLMPGREHIVIMGAGPGIVAAFTVLIWTIPDRPSIFGWPLKKVLIGVMILLVAFNVLVPLASAGDAVLSPTQILWGVGIAALYMYYLKSQKLMPRIPGAPSQEPWSQAGYLHDYKDDDPAAQKQRAKAQKEAERREKAEASKQAEAQAEQAKLDAILEKISREGMQALSKAEKKFLDQRSKRGKSKD
jgi:membrane associated rhomboid family serine protease